MDLWLNCISKRFPRIKVLEDVTAEISAGTTVALLGSNGAGKTTLLRCLATLSSPDSGDIRMDGEILKRGRIDLRQRLMFLPDFPDLFSHTDPLEVIAMHLKLWKADRPGIEQRVADLMDQLQIASLCGVPVHTFSRGQRYKTALAALATVDPELWLLDEPFASGMDPQGIATFRQEGDDAVKKRARILIYSTQMVDLACGFSDKIAVISRGRLTMYDTENDLQRDPRRLDALLIAPRS
ncbi:ABC-2 type transport system ATP-binding protein/heme exporter protein A [Prosthecobacter fusiformis]|uniref:ABC-2 type transport system ATP-binding protein/heme exporter protein A n=1 Tax=Prosthecobacter fusiformis TaxID=48464 RepID=A0A4R7RMM1_9BACT|nr:ABC transporter ATP-binding protein [Prosthecobacter fusiformis]TDU66582.1 ABC-2 type transport system ATP-binding protein/heme exporter protein A [Prosthecobacter fusiformis]